ncbi:peptidase C14 caspase catalytic subunit p20 [Rhodopseudomonas palustris TIE-1]|uniref:caspase family protein n=1 Tax=Rhodopseudomonas palustris TaxID=1076 RepID=UPI000164AA79|nr:caspase domain-containing protein [Rhodopseudomonas palustris]ACF01771.1 peptidase C14 caspase catalytic subunit p20 [Rhodopseudomonas palustris TIE-1]
MRLNHLFSVVSTILVVLIAGPVGPAAAQQQEKRIALVIGNGAYAKAPLSTAANDGGLIAQTLQAAGFDVSGARDLDGDTLRGAFRDFVKKAEDSGPDTVAAVYLAGYGVQYAGENYFIPVDSRLSRDTEIPTEGLRISDYLRQLAALPLKTSVVVLDLAREQPFVPGGSVASGLAMVEPNPKMLIAYNAAPGTVAPEERGAYGVYAQALAEMIRTGGLTLPQLFDRVRLRVNETTKGAQVPWDTQSVESNFMFFDRAPDAPPLPAPDQALRSKPIRDMGAAEAYAAALDRDTLQAYEDFLAAYPNDPLAKRVRVIVAARREAITWRRTYRVDTPDAYWSYLRRYPRGPHAADARRRLEILAAALEPPPSFTVIDYDVPPPPPDEIVYVDRPVLMFSDPVFDFAPPPPSPVFFLPPPPPDFVVLPPPPPPIGLFYLPRPLFVPIPAYVRPPVYVQPPPNNIIFANIHNTTVINQVINQPPAALANPATPVVSPPVTGPAVATPGATAPAVTAAAVASGAVLGAALPAAALHRATLIQQGKAPVPQSASIATTPPGGFAQRPGVQLQGPRLAQPAATPTQAPTTTAPVSAPTPAPGSPPSQPTGPAVAAPAGQGRPAPTAPAGAAPAVQALPVPGTKGLPPAPGVAARPGAPSVVQPQPPGRPALGPGGPAAARNGTVAPPAGSAPKPLAGTPPAGGGPAVRPEAVRPQQAPTARLRPTPPVTAPARPAGPPPAAAVDRRPAPAAPRIQRPAPPTLSRPVPPPMHVAPRVAPPPPPQHAAPRMAPPPAPVRAAPPPPHVAPPRPPAPPRAAPPPRPQGPAKRCPPGAKEC